jgi:hypothetical protein
MLGFGYNIVPVVRLHIGESPILTQTAETEPSAVAVSISPNPANEAFEVHLKGDFVAKDASLRVTDASGKTVLDREIKDSLNKSFTFAARQLPSGWYTVRLETAEGVLTKPLVIQH